MHHNITLAKGCRPKLVLISIKQDFIVTESILTALRAGTPVRLRAMSMTQFAKLLKELKERL